MLRRVLVEEEEEEGGIVNERVRVGGKRSLRNLYRKMELKYVKSFGKGMTFEAIKSGSV